MYTKQMYKGLENCSVAYVFKNSAQTPQFSAFEPKVFNIPLITVVYHM